MVPFAQDGPSQLKKVRAFAYFHIGSAIAMVVLALVSFLLFDHVSWIAIALVVTSTVMATIFWKSLRALQSANSQPPSGAAPATDA